MGVKHPAYALIDFARPNLNSRPHTLSSKDIHPVGHNPHDYLKDVLTRLPAMTNQDDLRPLLPGQWKNVTPVPPTTTSSK